MSELVSIIVPVYNCERYLKKNIQSLTEQSYKNLEIIYVDDGSSDGSADVVRSFMEKDSRIKLITQSNHGVSYARNTGLKAANGMLITFADADDYVEPLYVETMATAIREEQADIACSGFVLDRPDKAITFHNGGEKYCWNAVEAQKQLLSGELLEPGAVAKMFRREIVSNVFFCVGVKYNEDYLWVLEVFGKCKKVAFRAEANYHYVLHPNSATTNAPLLKRSQDLLYVAETAAAMPFSDEVCEILHRRRLLAYLDNYNSLIYGKGQDIKKQKCEVRQRIQNEKCEYKKLNTTLRDRFFYYGIRVCPVVYEGLFRMMKRILPDRRTFRI